jgi:hypothetical protein
MGCILEVFVWCRNFRGDLKSCRHGRCTDMQNARLRCEHQPVLLVRFTKSLRNNQLLRRATYWNEHVVDTLFYQSLIDRRLFQEGDSTVNTTYRSNHQSSTLCGWSTSEVRRRGIVGSNNSWNTE